MENLTETKGIVTKEFLADLRKCKGVVFRCERGEFSSASVVVECFWEEEKRGDWVKPERREQHNGFGGSFNNTQATKACFVELYANHGGIAALRLILRVGDVLRFEIWNNSSQLTEEAGITDAVIFASVIRGGRELIHGLSVSSQLSRGPYGALR